LRPMIDETDAALTLPQIDDDSAAAVPAMV
jgi:hypothetical protein